MSRPRSDPSTGAGSAAGRVLSVVAAVAPLVALLWVSSYARRGPELLGFPFFYWYQLAWVFVTAGLTLLAYLAVRRHDLDRRRARQSERDQGTRA